MTFSVENGSFAYKKDTPVLSNINLTANAGELFAILGPNGAGKTTLLRCAMGMLDWTRGKSLLDGQDIKSIPNRSLRRQIAYVPQAGGGSSALTVQEMVLLGRGSHFGFFTQPRKEDFSAAENAMQDLGILSIADKPCSEISGGEYRMTLIARAIVSDPKLLILDEPESNLDFKNQLLVLDTMTRLAASGMCCIFNTHFPAHALQRADKALLLSRGGGYRFGTVNEVITAETIESAFGVKAMISDIETPYGTTRDVIPLSPSSASGLHKQS